MHRTIRRSVFAALTLSVAACVSQSGQARPATPAMPPGPLPSLDSARAWPVRSFMHIDLWLHGFAMLTADTAKVPFFARAYREQMLEVRRTRNAYTGLDANRQQLSDRFTINPDLNNAQFAIFSFESWAEVVRATDLFLRAEGSPSAVMDPGDRRLVAYLADHFRSNADRAWLRMFVQAMEDERARFYNDYWMAERNSRNAALNQLETLWSTIYRSRFQRFLLHSRLGDGSFVPSMVLGGEGRSVFSVADGNAIAVTYPATADRAVEAIYVFTHEVVARVVEQAMGDNLTPAQIRAGDANKYAPMASVRAGAALLQRISPDDVAGYMRYYLRMTGATAPAGDPTSLFASTFALPDVVVEGIRKQIEAVLAGI
jgi:hypothetical protein